MIFLILIYEYSNNVLPWWQYSLSNVCAAIGICNLCFEYMISGPVASKHGILRSLLNAGCMSLCSTTGRWQHGVGRGGTKNGERNVQGGQGRQETETERRQERRAIQAEGRVPREGGMKKETIGEERARTLEVLQRRKCQLNSALTISGTGGTEVWNRSSGEWPRPTLTWAFSRRRSVLTGFTPTFRPDTAS